MTTTPNTTASGAADFPEFPAHPEPQIMRWSALEIVAIRKYGADMFRAGRLEASAPVAPTQPFGWVKSSEIVGWAETGGSINVWHKKFDCDVPVFLTPPATPEAAPAPQPGSVLVPAVPTEEMMRAGYDAYDVADCYGAMLDAAPKAAPAPVAEDAEIRKALDDAATALETIGRIAGRDQCMLGMMDVRLYAAARAKVAREAQAAQPEGGA